MRWYVSSNASLLPGSSHDICFIVPVASYMHIGLVPSLFITQSSSRCVLESYQMDCPVFFFTIKAIRCEFGDHSRSDISCFVVEKRVLNFPSVFKTRLYTTKHERSELEGSPNSDISCFVV